MNKSLNGVMRARSFDELAKRVNYIRFDKMLTRDELNERRPENPMTFSASPRPMRETLQRVWQKTAYFRTDRTYTRQEANER